LGDIIVHKYGLESDFFISFVSLGISIVIAFSHTIALSSGDSNMIGANNFPLFSDISSDILHFAFSQISSYHPLIRSVLISIGSVVDGITIVSQPIHVLQPVYSILSPLINVSILLSN